MRITRVPGIQGWFLLSLSKTRVPKWWPLACRAAYGHGHKRSNVCNWFGQVRVKFGFPEPIEGDSVPVTLDQGEALCSIRLEGEVTIASAAELKKLLLQALASGSELRVELEGATELDITSLQLLWAAGREARRSGRGFTLAGKVPEEISAMANDAGFEDFLQGLDPK